MVVVVLWAALVAAVVAVAVLVSVDVFLAINSAVECASSPLTLFFLKSDCRSG